MKKKIVENNQKEIYSYLKIKSQTIFIEKKFFNLLTFFEYNMFNETKLVVTETVFLDAYLIIFTE